MGCCAYLSLLPLPARYYTSNADCAVRHDSCLVENEGDARRSRLPRSVCQSFCQCVVLLNASLLQALSQDRCSTESGSFWTMRLLDRVLPYARDGSFSVEACPDFSTARREEKHEDYRFASLSTPNKRFRVEFFL